MDFVAACQALPHVTPQYLCPSCRRTSTSIEPSARDAARQQWSNLPLLARARLSSLRKPPRCGLNAFGLSMLSNVFSAAYTVFEELARLLLFNLTERE